MKLGSSGSVASLGLLITGSAALLPVSASAQNVPTREQVEIAQPEREVRPARVKVDAREAVQAGPCPLRDSTVSIDLQTIRFESSDGGAVPSVLLPFLANVRPIVTGNQPIAVVCDLRDAANAALGASGYIAGVQIPAQEITGGELRLTIIAGRLTDVTVRGESGPFRDAIRPRIDQLKKLFPLNQRDIERILLLAGDIPGLDVNLALRPGSGVAGELSGDLNIDATTAVLLVNVQNPGSRQLGREIGTVRAEFYGLTGLSDLSYLTASNSFQFDEQHVLQAGHEMGLGSRGLRIGARINYAISQPDITGLDIKTRSIIAGFDIKYPLLRQLSRTITGGIGFEYVNQETKVKSGTATNPLSRDRISIAYARLDGSFRKARRDGDSSWTLDGSIEVRKGLDILKANPLRTVVDGFSPSRFDGDARATVIAGNVEARLRIARNVWLTGTAIGQWSNRALLNVEEFSVGNLTLGRGYDPGANGADSMAGFRLEPRARMVDTKGFKLEMSAFYDNVRIWNRDSGTIETGRTLDSIGGGMRFMFSNRVVLDVTYAKPLKLALASDERVPADRVLLSLTTKLLPWRSGR